MADDLQRSLPISPGPIDPSVRCWIAALDSWLVGARRLGHELELCLAPWGLTEALFSLLWACGQVPRTGLSQSELAQQTGLSPAHVSGLVELLRRRGWLAGGRAAHDRRRQVWQLTVEGQETLEAACHRLAANLAPRWRREAA